ncbi:UPF0505 protein C16orf62 homolog [Trichogramma pretiosum]|uniref:UPF0505 protein C16orf62 homolog n=1 Tax=Trichogramma pretiosum TaxID=7493 RepID=UPI0006C948D5|nr:UPF0505 protein C16orf62 homolog [Trichogramma pretiosum]
MKPIQWFSCSTNFNVKNYFEFEEVYDHPLKPVTVMTIDGQCNSKRGNIWSATGTNSSTRTPTPTQITPNISSVGDPLVNHSSLDGLDPLTQFVREEMDPLSKIAADEWDYLPNSSLPNKKIKDQLSDLIEPWSSCKINVLNKYTTLEKLSMVTSFLPGGEKVVMKVQPNGLPIDKIKTRLGQLDNFDDGSIRQMHGLTQQEYVARIEQLNNELVKAWNTDQRVKALKIVIQCAKLLVDTSVISFYPSKYVLITDILDTFGKLVYERLKEKAKQESKTLPTFFTPEMVSENAKETCQNWFYKIASIRELVPRLYVEMAIMKSYNFLTTSEFSTILNRITKMIRGIGDPLVAIYARCYLCRVGLSLQTSDFTFVKENFYDFLFTYKKLFSPLIKSKVSKQNVCLNLYLNLYTPALDWILQVLVATASEDLLNEVLSKCKAQQNNALLLNTILTSFKPNYVVPRYMEFINLIEMSQDHDYPQYHLYRSLGECLIQKTLPKQDSQNILNIVWNYMKNLKDSTRFMHVMEIWIQFASINFSATEINLFLGEIINHLGPNRSFEYFYSQLQNITEKLVNATQDFDVLLTMDNFLPLIDLFQKENIKVDVCKNIIEGLSKQSNPITDPIVINAIMFILRIIHDSVSALTVADEKKQISFLICNIIQKIDHGRDFEKQLNFYVEARAAFQNLDVVHIQLVQCANRLSIDTRKIVKGHHTRRTSSFVQACAAFCYITIPSVTSIYTKLKLYLLSGQVAILNQCYGQADACFKAAINMISEMPKTMDIEGCKMNSEPYLYSYISNFLSTLLVIPDNPDNGVLYLIRGLLNVVQRYFDDNSTYKSHLYLKVLDLLSISTRDVYPYHINKVDSNDKLYGSDEKFINEINKISSKVLEELLNHLGYLSASDQTDKHSILAHDIFVCIILRADLTKPWLLDLAINLWDSTKLLGNCDSKIKFKTLEYIKKMSQLPQYRHFNILIKKLSQ